VSSENFIVSYPKSGRTWLRVLVSAYLVERHERPEAEIEDLGALAERAGLAPIQLIHDGSGIGRGSPWTELWVDKSRFGQSGVLLLSRSVPDTLVSSYFQATRRRDAFEGSMSSFLRSPQFGVRKVVTFLEQWHAARDIPARFLHLTYESMHDRTSEILTEALEFLGVREIDPGVVDRAVEYSRFENMRRLESGRAIGHRWLRPGDPDDPDSFKVRRGKVGGYREYLTPEDVAYVEGVVSASTCPWVRM